MNIINKEEAIQQNLKRYFTGIPCKHGHVCERYVSDARCIECVSIKNKNYVANNIEKEKIRWKTWRLANLDKIAETRKKWRLANPEKKKIADTAWRLANPEKVLSSCIKWQSKNPEKVKKYKKTYRNANKEKITEYNKAWKLANPDKIAVQSAKRRAKKRNQTPILTNSEALEIQLIYKEASLLGKNWCVDHIIPIAKGRFTSS